MVQLVKLGGSVITHKASEPSVREDVLTRLAGELADSQEELLLVHGAGSFGHPKAQAADLPAGVDGPEDARAMSRVQADVRRLNLHVLDALDQAGMAPVTLSPFGHLGCSGGKPGTWNLVPLHRCLGLGLTPVTHGDVVLDTQRGATIVSGDQLMVEIGRFARPDQAIFVLDEAGVYTGPPDEEGSELLTDPTLAELQAAAEAAGEAKGPDVTGGMAGKLQAATTLVQRGVPVAFIDGTEPGRLAEALAGKVTGTTVTPEEAP